MGNCQRNGTTIPVACYTLCNPPQWGVSEQPGTAGSAQERAGAREHLQLVVQSFIR